MESPFAVVAAVLLALSALAVPAQAQATNGPALAAPSTTLYAHSGDGKLWMSTVKEDEAGTDETVELAFFESIEGAASFALLPALPGPVVLDPAADIKFNIRFGSGLLANVGTVSTDLKQGSTLIASAEGELKPTVSTYGDVLLTAKAVVATLDPAAGDLVWTITFNGAGSAFLQVSQSDQWCNVVLPIVSPAAGAAGNATNSTGNATGNATNSTGNATTGTNATTDSPTTAGSATSSATASGTVAPASDGNQTAEEDAAGAPAPALVPLAMGLVAAATWLRRRRPPETAISPAG